VFHGRESCGRGWLVSSYLVEGECTQPLQSEEIALAHVTLPASKLELTWRCGRNPSHNWSNQLASDTRLPVCCLSASCASLLWRGSCDMLCVAKLNPCKLHVTEAAGVAGLSQRMRVYAIKPFLECLRVCLEAAQARSTHALPRRRHAAMVDRKFQTNVTLINKDNNNTSWPLASAWPVCTCMELPKVFITPLTSRCGQWSAVASEN
jgi:hypothetical protein